MVDEADRLRRDPALRGVPNPVEPGEPDTENLRPSDPVPGTGYERKEEHKREHDREKTPRQRGERTSETSGQ